jgi:hypothetical protein
MDSQGHQTSYFSSYFSIFQFELMSLFFRPKNEAVHMGKGGEKLGFIHMFELVSIYPRPLRCIT